MSVAAIFQLETPFLESELSQLRYEQNLDGFIITHMAHPPQRLRRFAHNDWRIDDAPIGVGNAAPSGVSATATINHDDEINGGYTAQTYQYAVTNVDAESGRESVPSDSSTVTNDLGTRPGSPLGNFNTITWAADALASGFYLRSDAMTPTLLLSNAGEVLHDFSPKRD